MTQADAFVDQANNRIGREIAAANPNASPQQLAQAALDNFHDVGLWTAQQNQDGTVSVSLTQITNAQYAHAQQVLNGLNSNGFTQAEQKGHDAEARRAAEQLNIGPKDDGVKIIFGMFQL